MLAGEFYECCRTEGHCPLWFGRDMWDGVPCVNIGTYHIKEGQIDGVDVAGVTIMHHRDGIGPTFAELVSGDGIREGAVYVSDNVTEEQKSVLDPFVRSNLGADSWGKLLGVKFVKIDVSVTDRTYHVVMPFGEQHITLTTGGDGEHAIVMSNPMDSSVTDVKFGNTDLWKYSDYGKDIVMHNTSGAVADFLCRG